MTEKIAVVGSGLIGRAWAISFAKAGYNVHMTDIDEEVLNKSLNILQSSLRDLDAHNLLNDQSAQMVEERITPQTNLEATLKGATYVQENTAELLEVKKDVYAQLDKLTNSEAVIGSSTSGFMASLFTENLKSRHRCLVAHPINPPYLVPAVELCPAPWTDKASVDKAATIMERAGHRPIRMAREIDGFIVNRLQIALLHEAFRLIDGGYASCEDVDTAIKDGLSHRWSFIGPLETGDLNAPGGIRDYCTKFGDLIERVGLSQKENAKFRGDLLNKIEAQRREILPAANLAKRAAWRDQRLMALANHKKNASQMLGD